MYIFGYQLDILLYLTSHNLINSTEELDGGYKKIWCVHVLDSLKDRLQILNTEWKQVVDDIMDRVVELEEALRSLQIKQTPYTLTRTKKR